MSMEYRIDFFALFIFLGVVQAAFLSFFFFARQNRQKQYNVFHGLLLLSISLCLLEIFLMYTGYIIHALYLVDFSEPFALLIGPLLYFFVLALSQNSVTKKTIAAHLAFPVLYTIALIPFLAAPTEVKYNAWINAFHPDWPMKAWEVSYDPWMFVITEWHTEVVLVSLVLYVSLSGIAIVQAFRKKGESFWKPVNLSLKMLRDQTLGLSSFIVILVVVKLLNKNDTGDHVLAAFGSLLIYANSISVINRSGFFKQATLDEQVKYKSSSLPDDGQLQQHIIKLKQIMEAQKPFLKPSFSLPELAQLMNLSVHSVSQIVNDKLGKSFFEMTAEYRIEEAKKLLVNQPNIKIEEIAEQVGYNSKSSFNTAFKKITGKTPSEFRG